MWQYRLGGVALPPPDRHLLSLTEAAARAGLSHKYLEWLSTLPVVPYTERTRDYYLAERNPLLVSSRTSQVTSSSGSSRARAASGAESRDEAGKRERSRASGRKGGGRLQHGWL